MSTVLDDIASIETYTPPIRLEDVTKINAHCYIGVESAAMAREIFRALREGRADTEVQSRQIEVDMIDERPLGVYMYDVWFKGDRGCVPVLVHSLVKDRAQNNLLRLLE